MISSSLPNTWKGWNRVVSGIFRALTFKLAPATLAITFLGLLAAAPSAYGQNLKTLHTFNFNDGSDSLSNLIMDATGNLYGTTQLGGASGNGTVFKLDPSGNETVLYSFTGGADAANPQAGLVMDAAGNLYGTTVGGGIDDNGTVFKLDPSGNETVLYRFTGGADGFQPDSGLIMDAAGNLYGTAFRGGISFFGTVFKLDPSGNFTVLYSFTAGADGGEPIGGLIMDAAGNLYGTTIIGGASGQGAVFKLDPSGNETVLYSFTGGADGGGPGAGLIMDAAGNLYSTTIFGGAFNNGTVFKLDASGHETVLHTFTGGADGGEPFAGLIMDAAGNLYGTAASGGASGRGTIFKIDTSGNATIIWSFTGGADGGDPQGSLFRDPANNLYGTTSIGGLRPFPFGDGTVFEIVAPTIIPTSGTTCNGTFNGTFQGNLTVSAGQICTFVGGGVTGNVQQRGGTLTLIRSKVGGNLQITGASTFSVDPGTSVSGDLQVQNLPASAAQNQICGTSVHGNLVFQNSGTALLIGGSSSCTGNAVGNDLTVQNNTAATSITGNTVTGNLVDQGNTAPTQVFNNIVGNNLQCQSNTSISGGGNTAKSKQGQCANF